MISAFLDPVSAKIRVISGGQNHSQVPFSRGFALSRGGYTPPFFGACKNPGNPVVFARAHCDTHHRRAFCPEFSRSGLWWVPTIAAALCSQSLEIGRSRAPA